MTTTPPHPRRLSPGPTEPDDPVRLDLHTPEDALAAVPVVLGFEPRESIAMLTFGGRETFHARVDLPPPGGLDEAVAMLVEPAVAHRVQSVLLVLYTDSGLAARRAQRRLRAGFDEAGIVVVEALRADGSRWWSLERRGSPPEGVRYDASSHRFRAESVLVGKVVHGSREELAALLDPAPDGVEAVARALRTARPLAADRLVGLAGEPLPPREVARLLLGLEDPELRELAWTGIDRVSADVHVRFWTDVVQRSPDDYVAGPASVLAVAAWLSGHGALAWCAVDRAQAADPQGSLARLVSDLLTHAVPPQVWDESRAALGLGLDPEEGR